jgi:hypothetical protein
MRAEVSGARGEQLIQKVIDQSMTAVSGVVLTETTTIDALPGVTFVVPRGLPPEDVARAEQIWADLASAVGANADTFRGKPYVIYIHPDGVEYMDQVLPYEPSVAGQAERSERVGAARIVAARLGVEQGAGFAAGYVACHEYAHVLDLTGALIARDPITGDRLLTAGKQPLNFKEWLAQYVSDRRVADPAFDAGSISPTPYGEKNYDELVAELVTEWMGFDPGAGRPSLGERLPKEVYDELEAMLGPPRPPVHADHAPPSVLPVPNVLPEAAQSSRR